MNTDDEISQMIGDCENRSERLSDWELKFIDSISNQILGGKRLTEKQAEKLETVWNTATEKG